MHCALAHAYLSDARACSLREYTAKQAQNGPFEDHFYILAGA